MTPLPPYVPPEQESDAPLDAVELAVVRFFVTVIADEIRTEPLEAERQDDEHAARTKAG